MNFKQLLSQENSIHLLRFSVALVFILHAVVRIYNGTIPIFAVFLSSKGLLFPTTLVWLITVYEIIGGMALMIGYCSKWLSIGFIMILLIGIILIHASLGWFVGEHGTGGVEYSFILVIALLVIISSKNLKNKKAH